MTHAPMISVPYDAVALQQEMITILRQEVTVARVQVPLLRLLVSGAGETGCVEDSVLSSAVSAKAGLGVMRRTHVPIDLVRLNSGINASLVECALQSMFFPYVASLYPDPISA